MPQPAGRVGELSLGGDRVEQSSEPASAASPRPSQCAPAVWTCTSMNRSLSLGDLAATVYSTTENKVFEPKSAFGIAFRDHYMRVMNTTPWSDRLLARSFSDDLELPRYPM
ncbi:hypothetical protein [Mycolicibacterium goodii]|uniref:hypothetical protein n=1 Tax=Mycolicibacterium goodii TaxID=134601 RepID=UPI00095AF169|nr:hypothetical protein EB74_32135 [Mycobacterium sp. SWH-M5]